MEHMARRRGRPPTDHRFLGDPQCNGGDPCATCEEITAYPPKGADDFLFPHATIKGWRRGCRCPVCVEFFLSPAVRHGTTYRYAMCGCRCAPCRNAKRMDVYRTTKGPALRTFIAYAEGLPADDRRHPDHPLFQLPPAHAWAAPDFFTDDDYRHPDCPPEDRARLLAEAQAQAQAQTKELTA